MYKAFSTPFLRAIAGVVLTAVFAVPAVVSAEGPYKVLDKWKLGGDGGWDYLSIDPASHKLYVTRGSRVDVVDTATGKITGSIPGLNGVHGVAFDENNQGYITNRGTAGSTVVVFNRATLATVATIPVSDGADGILFEPATKTVWSFGGRSQSATVIDTSTLKAVATLPLGGKPESAVADGKGFIFDNLEDKSAIVRIDARTRAITATWPAGCEGPSGLAYDASAAHLFSVCDKKMSVLDAQTGKQLAAPAIGDGPDAARYSATHKLAFASCGEGLLSVVDGSTFKVVESLPTEKRARTMAYDPSTDRIYTVTADFGPTPAPTAQNPRPRPSVLPGTFRVIVIGRD